MTENKKEPTFELQSWFDGGDIFFRPKDKKRLAEAIDAIVESDLGVAIIGSNDVILDHYCRMLVARMRKVERFHLDVFLPVSTDSLLTRFNKMLAEISLEQAAKPPVEGQAVRLLVINEARVVNEDQWALLIRLLSDFPGVNARLVLVINKSGWPAHEKLLQSLGKKMHRWVVNLPATDEARLLMDAAEDGGYQAETDALLIDIGLGTLVASRQQSDAERQEQDPDLPELPELDVDVLLGSPDVDELEADRAEEPESKWGALWRTALIISVSLALSSLAILWLYEDQSTDQALPQDIYVSQSNDPVKSYPSKSYKVESIAVPTEMETESKRLKAKEDLALSTETQAPVSAELFVESPVTSASVTEDMPADESSVVQAVPEEEQPVVEEQPSPQEPAPLSLEAQPEVTELEPEPVITALKRAIEEVASAPPSAYFVQHTVLSTELAAKNYVARYEVLNKALIVPVRLGQRTSYSIVSGPFNSRSAAALFTQNKTIPNDYWIRNVVQLQAVLRR
ncbi:hypothetical protein NYF23_00725 [SAR92 clade bacterium H455]|uniref:SPOR domain-containing protein n=1 Tax=SAR92 clade bacterium H455 TaxID=2974818 RepID=A0ABY5TP63_9GAMM|nr:hypothetical protein NYF23_00725 [SAR92 clade bacterium H455]